MPIYVRFTQIYDRFYLIANFFFKKRKNLLNVRLSHMETFGRNLKTIRKKWRFDQEGFGELMGVTRGQISQYEIGNNDPRIPFLIQLGEMTGISCKRLYEEELKREEIPSDPIQVPKESEISSFNEDQNKYVPAMKPLTPEEMVRQMEELMRRIEKLERK